MLQRSSKTFTKVGGSSLYIVIIIALLIAVLSSALVVSAYYYRLEYQKELRFVRLQTNLQSGINLIMASEEEDLRQVYDLYNHHADSIKVSKEPWGIYSLGQCWAFIQRDSLYQAFTIAYKIDTSKWSAIYLADEDRPLSVNGNTAITGNAYLPKAGIKKAFIEQRGFEGPDQVVHGRMQYSARSVPSLNDNVLKSLYEQFERSNQVIQAFTKKDSLIASFRDTSRIYSLNGSQNHLSNMFLSGNIILRSDSTITIDSTVQLNNILIFAKAVIIKNGFRGKCQLFARDSVSLGSNVNLEYPSVIGVMPNIKDERRFRGLLRLGPHSVINGILFTADKDGELIRPNVFVAASAVINGQLYTSGIVVLQNDVKINGNISASKFLYERGSFSYENYLVNFRGNSSMLSSSFLTSALFFVSSKKTAILQWLKEK